MRSRRIPALLTTTWRSPKVETAWSTSALAPAKELTLSVLATAWPPAAVISSTTDWAAETSAPEPSTAPPRSLTTTLAPSEANRSACSRPMPRPAPVMIATLPCNMVQPSSRFSSVTRPPARRRSGRDDYNGARACQTGGEARRFVAGAAPGSGARRRCPPGRGPAGRPRPPPARRPRRRSMSPRAAGSRWYAAQLPVRVRSARSGPARPRVPRTARRRRLGSARSRPRAPCRRGGRRARRSRPSPSRRRR